MRIPREFPIWTILVFMDKAPFNIMWLQCNYSGCSLSVKTSCGIFIEQGRDWGLCQSGGGGLAGAYNSGVPFAPLDGGSTGQNGVGKKMRRG